VRTLAKALAPVYMRVSGSWAAHTYFDVEGTTNGVVPEGFRAVLTTEQWDGVISFAKEVDAKLVTSMANTDGAHDETGAWNPTNSMAFLRYTQERGLEIAAAEFMNEPDIANLIGAPAGYTPADYGRDVRIFVQALRETCPNTKFVGPGSAAGGDAPIFDGPPRMEHLSTEELMREADTPPEIFTYHHYYGLSDRGGEGPHHPTADVVLTEEHLAKTERTLNTYRRIHDLYAPGTPYWNTETADAAMGGNTWGPTWLDVPRYVDQLGRLAKLNVTAVMHNTLCASDYGMLDDATHLPRPKYWAAWLWAQFMGTTVYDVHIPLREGLHAYAHSRRNGDGYTLVLINTSRTDATSVELPAGSAAYVLTSTEVRGSTVQCNGSTLAMVDDHTMPQLTAVAAEGDFTLPPISVTYVTVPA